MKALNSRREMPAMIASSARARRTGFTMVEMLAVLLILTILVALAVGVGQHVIEEAKRKQTIATQEIVMQAIQAYYDNHNGYPPEESDESDDCSQLMKDHLVPDKDAGELLKGLDSEAYAGPGIDGTGAALVDAYDGEPPMRYRISGGLGGGPVLISAGKDRDFGFGLDDEPGGGDDDAGKILDNIRSDGR